MNNNLINVPDRRLMYAFLDFIRGKKGSTLSMEVANLQKSVILIAIRLVACFMIQTADLLDMIPRTVSPVHWSNNWP